MELQSFTINDPIESPLQHAIEVTLLLKSGESRWCCFATPDSLTVFGDFLGDGPSRIHFGLPHLIVMESVTRETIGAALAQIDRTGDLREISKPIDPDSRESDADVWVFNGNKSNFPSALFRSQTAAEHWIQTWSLNGTLTRYPIDISVYDWAVKHDLFNPKRDDQRIGEFVGRFTSASQSHYHCKNGKLG